MGLCSTPKERASLHEVKLAEIAGIRDQEFQRLFLPLEIKEVAEVGSAAREQARAALVGGRTSADVADADAEARQTIRSEAAARGVGLQDITGRARSGIDRDVTEAAFSAGQEARELAGRQSDEERLGAIRLGQDVGATTLRGTASLARQEGFASSERLRSKTAVRQARLGAIGQAGSTGILRVADERDRKRRDEAAAAREGTG